MSQSATRGHGGRFHSRVDRRSAAGRAAMLGARKAPRRGYTPFQHQWWDVMPSAASVGVFLYLRGLPADASVSQKDLSEVFREGRDAMGRALDELLATGLLVRVVYKGESGKFLTRYVVRESPVTAADVVEIAAEQDTVHMVVPTGLVRVLRRLGLGYQLHTDETVIVTGFTNDTRTLDSAQAAQAAEAAVDEVEPALEQEAPEEAPESGESVFALVATGYGFPSDESGTGSDSVVVTGSGFPGSLN